MIEIKLLNSTEIAIIDESDFDTVQGIKWRLQKGRYTNYVAGTYNGTVVLMHRLILGVPSGVVVDHINGNGIDNRRENLRTCTYSENNLNKRGYKNNHSGIKGVSVLNDKWAARITHKGRVFWLGVFSTPDEAANAYNEAAKRLHGEFALLNKVA